MSNTPDNVASSSRLRRVHAVADALSNRAARRAAAEAAVLLPLLIGIPYFNTHQATLLGGINGAIRVVASAIMVVAGWAFARDVGRVARPTLLRSVRAEAAGPLDFLLRAGTLVAVVAVALNVAGIELPSLGLTGALTVVLVGLAAQQTLGNVFAGVVLLGVHPYHIGDSVRLQGGGMAGMVEGRVSAMGLFYTRLTNGADQIHVPNAAVLNSAVTPLREPDSLDLRATLAPGVTPTEVQAALRRITTRTRKAPRVEVEEMDLGHVVVRISATPQRSADGAKLADEVVSAIAPITG